jgi:nicotinamidase-related amidase
LHDYRDKYAMLTPVEDGPYVADAGDDGDNERDEVEHRDKWLQRSEKYVKQPVSWFKYSFQLQEDTPPGWEGGEDGGGEGRASRGHHRPQQRATVLVIHPQADFLPTGSWPMAGADRDAEVIAAMIQAHATEIHDVVVSMTSRHLMHISHALFWVAKNNPNRSPAEGVFLTAEQLRTGIWQPRDLSHLDWCVKYLTALEKKGGKLRIVPMHCLFATRGHAVVAPINEALQQWATASKRPISYIATGHNCCTEMYSALGAEVEDPLDASTSFNAELMAKLRVAEKVRVVCVCVVWVMVIGCASLFLQLVVCGSASSPYMNSTVRDLIKYWRGDTSKIVFVNRGKEFLQRLYSVDRL